MQQNKKDSRISLVVTMNIYHRKTPPICKSFQDHHAHQQQNQKQTSKPQVRYLQHLTQGSIDSVPTLM